MPKTPTQPLGNGDKQNLFTRNFLIFSFSQLSGSHGEWTMSDDVVFRLMRAIGADTLNLIGLGHVFYDDNTQFWVGYVMVAMGLLGVAVWRRARAEPAAPHPIWAMVHVADWIITMHQHAVSPFDTMPFRGAGRNSNTSGAHNAGSRHKQANNVKNKGTGGKSKVARDPQPKDGKVDKSKDGAYAKKKKSKLPPYVCSAFPETRTLFSLWEVNSATPEMMFHYDCQGAPYCGYTCIDIATRNVPNPEAYQRFMVSDDPLDAGTFAGIKRYSQARGVNLAVLQLVGGQYIVRGRDFHNPTKAWVVLIYEELGLDEDGESYGHYVLACSAQRSDVSFGLPWVSKPFRPRWLLACLGTFLFFFSWVGLLFVLLSITSKTHWVSETRVFFEAGDGDKRAPIQRRDKIESQDKLVRVRMRQGVAIAGREVFSWTDRWLLVSVVRVVQTWREVQSLVNMGLDPAKALPTIGALRVVNTDDSLGSIMDSMEYMRILIGHLKDASGYVGEISRVCYNATYKEIVAGNTMQQIIDQQDAGARGAGVNHIKSVSPLDTTKLKENMPVAYCPIGQPITDDGPVGAGFYPLTDQGTLLSAYCLRAMTQKPKIEGEVRLFLSFARNFLRQLVNATDVQGLDQEDCREAFRKAQRGKQSQAAIEQAIREYDEWLLGKHNNTNKHSAFVKFENSAKESPSGWGVKPRLIMTMSNRMKIECSQILAVIHKWNAGPFSKYQVKDMSPADMIQKIQAASDGPHTVSDYSSFEASLDSAIRTLENDVMLQLCHKAGLHDTARSIRRHAFGGRNLHTKAGVFKIYSRCSGDYWTSFGNGIVNVCIMAYCAHRKRINDFSMIAEGDDGLVPRHIPDDDIIKALGFGYSTNLHGENPGDCDFLRSRWINGKRFLDIGRCFNAFWARSTVPLKHSKQMFLIRAAANSLYWLSPGHPVIMAIVSRILRETRSYHPFKGYERYLNKWGGRDYAEIADRDVALVVDETMRAEVAFGAGEFPPLSITSQLVLERRILEDAQIYVGLLLDDFDSFKSYKRSKHLLEQRDVPAGADWVNLAEFIQTLQV